MVIFGYAVVLKFVVLCPQKNKKMFNKKSTPIYYVTIFGTALSLALSGCGSSAGNGYNMEPPAVPVLAVDTASAITYKDYSAALEGKVNIEIRAQVDGYIDKIFVDEGAYVSAGQSLFKINDLPYQEQLNTALANQHAAEANLAKAQLELDKFEILTKNNVVSDIQLKTAKSSYEMAKASLEQTKASVGLARINIGYTLVKAPVSGFIGRIPKRLGSLVGRMDAQALTTLSDVHEVYAYFSMSEMDFITFNKENAGNTTADKIKGLPPVSLILADGNPYDEAGKIEMVDGQFDKTTGSISLRANFPNSKGLLRSGNTGRVRVSTTIKGAVSVPQEATFEVQDKVFVYVLADSNKIQRMPIVISGKSGDNYLIKDGIERGTTIVTGGLNSIQDGMVVAPKTATADSSKTK